MLGIVVNLDHKMAICLICSSTVPPTSLYGHIRKPGHHPRQEFHRGQRLSFATSDFCKQLIKRHKLEDPRLRQPTAIVTAVFGLPIREGFFCCDECAYAAQNKKTMTRHCREVHHGHAKFVKGPCQTWFPSSQRQYFAVKTHRHPNPDPLDPITLFIKEFSSDPYENLPIQAVTHPRDVNIFLRYENWLEEVQGMTGAQIFDISRDALPKLRPMVRSAVSRYVLELVKKLEQTDPAERLAVGDYAK